MSLIPFLSSSLVFSVGTAGFMAALELSSWLAFSAFLHPSDHLRSPLKSAVAAQEGPSFSFFLQCGLLQALPYCASLILIVSFPVSNFKTAGAAMMVYQVLCLYC